MNKLYILTAIVFAFGVGTNYMSYQVGKTNGCIQTTVTHVKKEVPPMFWESVKGTVIPMIEADCKQLTKE